MNIDTLDAIRDRITIAKACFGDRFELGLGEHGRQVVDVVKDQDREALYLEVLALSARLAEVEAALDIAQQAAVEWRTKLAERLVLERAHEADRGEILKACPRCRIGQSMALPGGTMFHCPCGYSYHEPSYWQRVKKPATV